MGKLLGTRRWRRTLREVDSSPQALYLKALGQLDTVRFHPGLQTAAELISTSTADGSNASLRAAS